jgi:hypothetical protein
MATAHAHAGDGITIAGRTEYVAEPLRSHSLITGASVGRSDRGMHLSSTLRY